MKTMSVNRKWFEDSGVRLDASFHLSDGLLTLHKLKKCPYPMGLLKDETERIFKGGIFKRTYVDSIENGYDFITASDMMKSDILGAKFISKKYSSIDHLFVDKGWTLVSRSGTLGNTAFTNEIFEDKVLTDDLIRIVPNNKNILGGYLYAFLSSHYGYGLLTQSGYGGVVQHIEPHHIENIPIPILPEATQQKIHNLITEASQLRVQANKLLKESVAKIDNFLGNKRDNKILTGKVSISEISNGNQSRIDAPTFINESVIYKKLLHHENIKFSSISDLGFKVTRPGIFKRVKVDGFNGIPYIKGSELNKLNPFGSCEYLSKTKTPFLDQLKLRVGQVLFTCAGTVGDVRLISKEFEDCNAVGSQDIIRIDQGTSDISNLYLFAFLKTRFAKEYAQSLKYGSVIERVEPFHVGSIPIAIPENNIYNEIVNSIGIYNDSMYLAFVKEKTAIDLIEKEIDQGQQL